MADTTAPRGSLTLPPAFGSATTNPYGLENVGTLASPSFVDIDGDGDLDALIGNNDGNTVVQLNTGSATAPAFGSAIINPYGLVDAGSRANPSFVDIDGDGDLDALIGNNDGNTVVQLNIGSATAPAFGSATTNPYGLRDVRAFVDPFFSFGAAALPSFVDIDGDGDLDALIGSQDGDTVVQLNTGSATAPAFGAAIPNAYGLGNVGNWASPNFVDIDGDGDLDALIGNNIRKIVVQLNTGSATVPAFGLATTNPYGLLDAGILVNPSFVDIDGDGDLDALIGNLDGNTVVQLNTGGGAVAPVTTTTADGTYGVGTFITLTVGFNENVIVNTTGGTPTLRLETGTTDRNATYFFGSGTSTLSFRYIVQAGDTSADLDQVGSRALSLNGGTIRDAAGNNAVLLLAAPGTIGSLGANKAIVINTSASSGPSDDFVVLQPSNPAFAGAGVGNDTYLLSGTMIPAGKAITISDSFGSNTLQLAPGLSVASSLVSATALKLTLTNGASLTVLGADEFRYDVGGNLSAGLNPADLSFVQFVQNTLGTTLPTTGRSSGGAFSVGSGPAASLLASTASGDDFIVAQVASPATIGAGAGNDTYLLSPSLVPAGTNLTISDALGVNSIQLASGLQIASAQVTATALKLNLTSGATVTVLGADRFTFEAGGNTSAGINQADITYSQFVQNVLGTTVPATGISTSGAITIGGGSASAISVSGNQVVNATAAADVFSFNAVSALADAAGTNTQATLIGFSTANDRLVIDLAIANSAITTLAQLNGQQGVSVQINPFTGVTLINFGNDANGSEPVTLTLLGITDPAVVQIQVV